VDVFVQDSSHVMNAIYVLTYCLVDSEKNNTSVDDNILINRFHITEKKTFSTLEYDDDMMSLVDDPSSSTTACTFTDVRKSTGSTYSFSLDAFEADLDEIEYNYNGPNVIPKNETPVTICTAGTIGDVSS
jgi:hypothetical protein